MKEIHEYFYYYVHYNLYVIICIINKGGLELNFLSMIEWNG